MAKYLLEISYTVEGAKGVLKDGGTKRTAAAKTVIESVGGRVESMYFAFGKTDVFVIADFPDASAVAAAMLTLGASGVATGRTTVLLSAEDIDKASKKTASYTAPGH